MKPSKILLLLFSSNFLLAGAVFSGNGSFPNDSELKDLDENPPLRAVVTATRREIPVEETTRFVTVLTREDIEKSGAVFVVDLLRALPGVTVTQSGPLGRTVGLFVRGMNANQTLMMVDGVQINSLTTGQAELADLTTENVVSVENIERIEILRGPQSTLYGADAMAGVINIVTKAGKRPLGGESRFEYGTNESFYEAAVIEGQWKNFSYSGSGSRLDTEGPGDNDGFQNTRATGHAKIDVTDISHFDVAFHYYNALVGIDDGPFRLDPNRNQKSREQILSTIYTLAPSDAWEQSLKYSFFHDNLFSIDPRNPGATGRDPEATPFKLDSDRHTFEWQHLFFLGEIDVITAGYEFEHGRSNNKSFDRIIRNHGWYLQNELTLWDRWTTVLGVRIDENQFFGTEPSPSISMSYWVEPIETKLKGSFGRGIRAPTLNELFFPGFGNPNLLVEKSWGGDVGFERSFWEKKASLGAAYFQNEVENLIQFTGIPLLAQNIDQARTQGVELEGKYNPLGDLEFRWNYTYLNAIDSKTGKRLIRRPWHSGRLGMSYRFWKCQLNVDWVLLGPREDRTAISGRPPREKNPGYTRLDALLTFDLNKWLQVYFRGENLTNDHYDEVLGFDNPSTRLFIGTKARF
ncbi:MAG: TonB-dependent receptor [Candidatus Omnitrophica bacterium]|nr:TonB-dependent receptor [Candidatus Omnitrophota bacterium]